MEENKDTNQESTNESGGIVSTTGEGIKEVASTISSKLSKKGKKKEEQSVSDAIASGSYGESTNKLASGDSITGVTFEPTIQTDFSTSHFWEKSEHLLIVFYEYKSYEFSSEPAFFGAGSFYG